MVEIFSGFLNLKIAKELVIFKGQFRVGRHIPPLMIQFNVSRDLKPFCQNGGFMHFKVSQQMKVYSEPDVVVVLGPVLHRLKTT